MSRISSLDDTYQTGDLSVFSSSPRNNLNDSKSIDSKESLYEVSNNAETKLRSSLSYNGKIIIVNDASKFPSKGLVRVGPPPGQTGPAELIYYGQKTKDTFKELIRGFAGSKQNQWSAGAWATNAVTAEPHNAVKDAIINIQKKLGLKTNPEEGSLNKRLKSLEARFLAPKASFRAFPKNGPPQTPVRFQNFSEGDVARYLWDFGDGTQSVEKNPTHIYQGEGIFTVKLNIITNNGAQGISTKSDYIKISEEEKEPFFYFDFINEYEGNFISRKTAEQEGQAPTEFVFVDQTDGEVKQRFWIFGDGTENQTVIDPNIHEIRHIYEDPGEYTPSLLIVFSNETLKRVFLQEKVIVL